MNRRDTVLALLALGAAPLAAEAQQPKKLARVGVLSPGSPPLGPLEAFRQELRDFGHVEGRNLAFEWRFAEGRNERLTALAEELVRLDVDVILVINTGAAQIVKKATATIPVVFVRVSNPVRSGLVASLARPGGNITGVSNVADELSGKRLEMLKTVLPHASRVAVLWNAGNPGAVIIMEDLELASRQLQMQLQSVRVRGQGEFRDAFETIRAARADALFVQDDLLITSYKREILDFANESRLPVMSLYEEFVESTGLLSYGPSIPGMYRRAAVYVDKILKGAKPADLPVDQPTTFKLVINLKTARALGLAVPKSILLRADRVIE